MSSDPTHKAQADETPKAPAPPTPSRAQAPETSRWLQWRTPLLTALFFVVLYTLQLRLFYTNPNDVALGDGMFSITNSKVGGHPVRNDVTPAPKHPSYWTKLLPSSKASNTLFVWLGNSHLHALNGANRKAPRVCSTYLHLATNGAQWPGPQPVFGLSYPNLNAAEQFLLSLWLLKTTTRPKELILLNGVRLWDTRMTTRVRPALLWLLQSTPIKQWFATHAKVLAKYPEALELLKQSKNSQKSNQKEKRSVEGWLRKEIGPHIPFFRDRNKLNSSIRTMLNSLRNTVFRIKASSKRGLLKGRYKVSMQFFDLMIFAWRNTKQKMLLYNVPLRPGKANPYRTADYKRFKQAFQKYANNTPPHIQFVDYGAVLPVAQWGELKNKEKPDFSHFSQEGHEQLAGIMRRELMRLQWMRAAKKPPPPTKP